MRHDYLLVLFFLTFSLQSFAQRINRQYSFQPQENGSLYFIHPQKGFESKDKEAIKGLVYDITYLTAKDSASYTFTYFNRTILKADSIKFFDHSGKLVFANKANMYYVQPKGNNWQHRTMVSIPYSLLVELYQNDSPFTISIEGGKKVAYVMSAKKWDKQAKIVRKVFDVVTYNK